MQAHPKQKTVFITGGSDGIGLSSVKLLLETGYNVFSLDIKPPTSTITSTNFFYFQGDVCTSKTRLKAVDEAIKRFGKIDILINNAGIGMYSIASNTDIENVKKLFEVNFFGLVELTRIILSDMKQRNSGKIINIGSVGGYSSLPWASFYCASKFALHAFSDSLRREFKKKKVNIGVTRVCFGIVQTKFREHIICGKAPAEILSIRKTITPQSAAESILKATVSNRSVIYNPAISVIFTKTEQIAPRLMDWYLEKKW